MFKIMRLVSVIICISTMITSRALAQDRKSVWTVEVIGANGLKNTDWGANKLSDPFVDIFIFDKQNTTHERTPIISDTLNPQWQYKIRREYAPGEMMPMIVFVVRDHDKLGNRLLGVARLLRPIPGRVYSLDLHKGKIAEYGTELLNAINSLF
ncbi:MAG: C2 domain-containing protein, partial [Desulfobacterales bacterium]